MVARYILLASLFALGAIAADGGPADNTRNFDANARAAEARNKEAKKTQKIVNAQHAQKNKGGHPTTSGLRLPKSRRSIDEIVKRAVDDYLEDSLYARSLYEDDGGLYARDAELDFDDLYY